MMVLLSDLMLLGRDVPRLTKLATIAVISISATVFFAGAGAGACAGAGDTAGGELAGLGGVMAAAMLLGQTNLPC